MMCANITELWTFIVEKFLLQWDLSSAGSLNWIMSWKVKSRSLQLQDLTLEMSNERNHDQEAAL